MKQFSVNKAIVIITQDKGCVMLLMNQSKYLEKFCQFYKVIGLLSQVMTQQVHWKSK